MIFKVIGGFIDYRYGSHTVFKIQRHFVFVTKDRYKVLVGDVGLKVRELIRQTCEVFENDKKLPRSSL